MSNCTWKAKGVPRVLLALLVVVSSGAFAAEGDSGGTPTTQNGLTEAGTSVVNGALLDYEVLGATQTQISATPVEFVVDRLIDVNVTRVGTTKFAGAGGVASLTYAVTNESNADLDMFLRAVQVTNDLDTLGTQVTTASTVGTACIDGDATGTCNDIGGADTELTPNAGVFLLSAADTVPGTPVTVVVEVTTDGGAGDGEYDTFVLAAGVGSGSQFETDDNGRSVPGTGAGTDTDDQPLVVENVFGDDIGSDAVDISAGTVVSAGTGAAPAGGDVSDGQHSAQDQLQIQAANLTITKVSEVIWDPIQGLACNLTTANDGTNDYADCDTSTPVVTPNNIPGAIVRYTITVSNDGAATAAAQDVAVTDTLPTEIEPGNDEGLSGLDNTVCTGATGLVGAGGTCTGAPETYLDRVVVTDCDGNVDASTTLSAASTSVSETVADTTGASIQCEPSESGTIVYYMTIP